MKKFICLHCGANEYSSHDNGEPCQRCMGEMIEAPELDKSNPINIDMIDQEVMDNLITEIVRQAVADWTSLCKCRRADKDCWACKGIERSKPRPSCVHRETRDCNFTELEMFFESGCAGYISQGAAERIYKKLRKERVKHENALQNQSVCGVAAPTLSRG